VSNRWWTGVPLDIAFGVAVTGVMLVASAQSGDQPAWPMDAVAVAAVAAVGATARRPRRWRGSTGRTWC